MLATLTALLTLGSALPAQMESDGAKKVELHDPVTLKADFNAAAGAPRVVIILSPS